MIQLRFFKFNPLLSLVLFIGFIILIYYIMIKMLVYLYFLTPLLFLGAFLVNPRTVKQWGKNLLLKFKKDPILGFLNLIVQLLVLPFVSIWLLFLGYFQRKLNTYKEHNFQKPEDGYTPYEIIEKEEEKRINH